MATPSLGLRIVDPSDIRVYNINWTNWLQNGSISSSSWTVPIGLMVYQTSNTTAKTSIKLGGFVAGTAYTIFNLVQSSSGETRQVNFDIECK